MVFNDRLLDRLIRWSFYLIIFLLPVSIAFVESFSGFAIFFYLIKRIAYVRGSKLRGLKAFSSIFAPPQNVLRLPLLFFMGAIVVSVVFSQYHYLSVVGFIGKFMQGYMIYIAFCEAFTETASIRNFVYVWLASALITASNGLFQYLSGFDFLRHNPCSAGRISSSLRQANDFGAYLITVSPVLLFMIFNLKSFIVSKAGERHRWKEMALSGTLIIGFLLLMVCLGLTFSRASWVAFFIAIFVSSFYKKRNLLASSFIISFFLIFFLPMMVQIRDASLFRDDLKGAARSTEQEVKVKDSFNAVNWFNTASRQVGSGRRVFWEEAIRIIKAFPITGSGLNTYAKIGPQYKITWGGYPHNSYLQMTAELGFLGISMFLWLLWVLMWSSYKSLGAVTCGDERWLLLGATAGLLAYLIQSFFDTTFYSVQLSALLWIMMALIVTLQNRLTKTQG